MSDEWIVWDYVEAESDAHLLEGRPVGSKLWESREAAVEAVVVAVLSFTTGKAWVEASEARWTNIYTTLRRWLVSASCHNILVDALRRVKLELAADDSLEAALVKIIANDQSDFSAQNRLRLLRVCRALSSPETLVHLCVMVVAGGPLEQLQYALFGSSAAAKPALEQLLHPRASLIAKCQDRMLRLAEGWHGGDGCAWALLPLMGICMAGDGVRMVARKQLLQLSSGLLDVFELRLSGHPYRLAWLAFPDVDQASPGLKRFIRAGLFTP